MSEMKEVVKNSALEGGYRSVQENYGQICSQA